MTDGSTRFFERLFLGRRDLVLLWLGQLAAGFGDSLAAMGFLVLARQLTGSQSAVGLFQTVAYIPIIIFGLAAGVYVDRRDRRRVMLVADGGRALALAALPLLAWGGALDIWTAGIVVVLVSTLTTFFNPAYNSALPIIVRDPAKLFGVNAVMQSSRQFAAIAGPLFAAVGAGAGGVLALLTVNSVTYVISFVCILLIGTRLRTVSVEKIGLADLKREAVFGLRAVFADRAVRTVFIVTLINNFFLMGPAVVGTLLLVQDVFHGTLADFAGVELMYALGMTITGLILHRVPVRSVGRLWSIGLVLDGFTFLLYLPAHNLPLLYAATFVHALAIPLIIVSRATIVQRLLPQELLGRAFGYIDIAVFGVMALSAGVTGFVAEQIGPLHTIVYGGVGAGICGLFACALPSITGIRFNDPASVAPEPAPQAVP